MNGKYEVKIANKRVGYTLQIERNITILTGESGIGKTSIVRLVQNYEEYGKKSGVSISCKRPCRTISSNQDWEDKLGKIHNSIIFIDEGRDFLRSHEFASSIENNDNYFVLITREGLPQLAYSVEAILSLKETVRRDNRIYSKTYPCYSYLQDMELQMKTVDKMVTEDSNAGFQMYNAVAERFGRKCESAGGKSSIALKLSMEESGKSLVIADGAAFGSEINKIAKFIDKNPNRADIYLPESFEWLLLKSGIVNAAMLGEILENPAKYIYSEQYTSWERYFTDLLIELTKGTALAYRKDRLNKAYLVEIMWRRSLTQWGDKRRRKEGKSKREGILGAVR